MDAEVEARCAAVEVLAAARAGRFRHREAIEIGLTAPQVRWRCRPDGPWRRSSQDVYVVRRLADGDHGEEHGALLGASPSAGLGPFASARVLRLDVDRP